MVDDMAIIEMYVIFHCEIYVEIFHACLLVELFEDVTSISYLFIYYNCVIYRLNRNRALQFS